MSKTKPPKGFIGLEYRDPNDLKVAPNNTRIEDISDSEKEMMKLSVMIGGIKEPIIINLKNEIVSGSLRWQAALASGLKCVPCIVKEFEDGYEELITCMCQDDLHHTLTDREKKMFVDKCRTEFNKTDEEIARSLGKSPQTIKLWSLYDYIPEQIKGNQSLINKYLDIPMKKKLKVKSMLATSQFKNNPLQSAELIESAETSLYSIWKEWLRMLKTELK